MSERKTPEVAHCVYNSLLKGGVCGDRKHTVKNGMHIVKRICKLKWCGGVP
jgi:hypothetical protein